MYTAANLDNLGQQTRELEAALTCVMDILCETARRRMESGAGMIWADAFVECAKVYAVHQDRLIALRVAACLPLEVRPCKN